MRKAFTLVLLALAIMIVAVSCDDPNHEHSFDANKWESDDTSHWHVCTICGAKSEVAAHTNTEEEVKTATCVDAGSKKITCSVCGREVAEEIKALGHDFQGDEKKCIRCQNTESDVEAAEARIGLKYYTEFEEAVYAAATSTDSSKKTVEVLKDKITLNGAHVPVNGSVTINANNADFNNSDNENDLGIYTKAYSDYTLASGTKLTAADPETGTVEIVVNNAKNLKIWGNGDLISTGTTVNVILNECEFDDTTDVFVLLKHDESKSLSEIGKLNIKVDNCNVKKVAETNGVGVTADFASKVEVLNSTFTNTYLGINISNDQTAGCEVTISGCTFTNCGKNETFNENDANYPNGYSAPIRLKNSEDGTMTATLEGNTFSGTVSTKLGDVMLVDSRKNKTVHPITATFKDNSALNVTVYGKTASEEASSYKIESLEANVTKTIKQTKDNYSIE